MIKTYIVPILLFAISPRPIQANANACALALDIPLAAGSGIDRTNNLITYLQTLLENKSLGDGDILRLATSLKNGEFQNPILEEQVRINSAARIQWEKIRQFVDGGKIDQQTLLKWCKSSLSRTKFLRTERLESTRKTESIYQKMSFHPVPAGSFEMGEDSNKRTVEVFYPFEMLSTPVTQKQWLEVMGDNPSTFAIGDQAITLTVNGRAIKIQPDNPVENITWWSAAEFANRLSLREGFQPVYNTESVEFKSGSRAENGTLTTKSGQIEIYVRTGKIEPGNGFRLPTEIEIEYVMRALGRSNGKFHFGDDWIRLKDYAWYISNSKNQTHPVAELKPLVVNGNPFYDLYGNVWEWSHDLNPSSDNLGDKDIKDGRISRGGSFLADTYHMHSSSRHFGSADDRYKSLGFRLVRTIGIKLDKDDGKK